MATDSQELDSPNLLRSSAESEELDSNLDASPESNHNDSADLFVVNMPYIELSVFDDLITVPESIQKLAKDPRMWSFLSNGGFNLVSKSIEAVAYPSEPSAQSIVKKLAFPYRDIFLYRSHEATFNIQISEKYYICSISSEGAQFNKLISYNPTVAIKLNHKLSRLFVLHSSGLYLLKMRDYGVQTISTEAKILAAIEEIVLLDAGTPSRLFFKLTSQSVTHIQQICPDFCPDFNPIPEPFNQKTRTVRLFSYFYPELQVYALDEQTLIMPYFERQPSTEEIIKEGIRLFIEQRRILLDMSIVKNFRKASNGKVYCIDPDMAFSVKKRRSKASLLLLNDCVNVQNESGKENDYQKFLYAQIAKGADEKRLAIVTLGLLNLIDIVDDVSNIRDEWITEDWLNLIYSFSLLSYEMGIKDLQAFHNFSALIKGVSYNPLNQYLTTGYQRYYYCCVDLIQQKDADTLKLFLQTLAQDTVKNVLELVSEHSLLTLAVLAGDFNLVDVLIESGSDPTVQDDDDYYYTSMEWAIFKGHWSLVERLAKEVPKQKPPKGNGFFLWSMSEPTPRVTLSELSQAMQTLDNNLQFHSRLERILAVAKTVQHSECKEKVYSLIQIAREYFLNLGHEVNDKNNVFITKCKKSLPSKFISSLEQEGFHDLVAPIRELRNALSLATPTASCVIS